MVEVNAKLELLRHGLRQAAIFSPSQRTRWACDAALQQQSPIAMLRVTQSLSCEYAPRLRSLIDDYYAEGPR
jgi:hypothetical protein